jgi:co-chaperonin GroES (HSP10)
MTIQNNSGIKATGRAVLCRPYDPEMNKSIIAIPDHVRAMELMRETRATVLQLGAHCWPDEPPRAEIGDNVLISKFCGAIVKGPKDGNLYRIINDNDIYAVIESENMAEVIVDNPIVKSKQIERTTSAAKLEVPRRVADER